jgi:glycosyltransferase involved in cell wall biosynthesis
MKIFRIIARLNVGGPARHVVWLTKELQDAEFHSVLASGTIPAGEEDMGWFAAENRVEPVFIPEMSRELSVRDVVSLYKVYRAIKREKPDIIHTHTAKAGTIGRAAGFLYRWLTFATLIGKPRRVRIVHTFHGHVFHSYYGSLKTKVFLTIEKLLARTATDKIVTITQQQFDEIHKKFGVGREGQFEIIPLGIDLGQYADQGSKRDALRNEIGAKDDEIVVGFVGRLTEIKNVSLLLKTAEIYKERGAGGLPRLRFVIIGDGNLREELEAEADSLGLGRSVTFLGNRDEADIFYAGLDIVALTSLNEGTPLSLIEAMACGKAVISTAVGGVVDLLGDIEQKEEGFALHERGILVDPGSPEAFYSGLIFLAKNEKLRERSADAGQTYARMNYNKERLVNDIKNLYRDLATGRK